MRRKRWLLLGVALLAVAGGALAFAAVGEGSDLHKQALYLRQVADAYLQLLKDL